MPLQTAKDRAGASTVPSRNGRLGKLISLHECESKRNTWEHGGMNLKVNAVLSHKGMYYNTPDEQISKGYVDNRVKSCGVPRVSGRLDKRVKKTPLGLPYLQ